MSNMGWYADLYGIFFDKPVEIGGTMSSGPGGFSQTFFQRTQQCTACGACCKRTFRDEWQWFGVEPRPDEEMERRVEIFNGVEIEVFVYKNKKGDAQCDFLQEDGKCGIHMQGVKPIHCVMSPQIHAYVTRGVYYLSKRLPSRNWRWPQCPIVMADTPPPNEEEKKQDMKILETYYKAFGHVEGCMLGEIIELMPRLYDMREFYRVSSNNSLLTFKRMIEVLR